MWYLLAVNVLGATCFGNVGPPPLPLWSGHITSSNGRQNSTYLLPDLKSLVLIDEASTEHVVSLHKHIVPTISAEITSSESKTFVYTYSISNSLEARENIVDFAILVPRDIGQLNAEMCAAEAYDWSGGLSSAVTPQCEIKSDKSWKYVEWVSSGRNEIAPGKHLKGFCLKTSLLPGFTTGYFSGGALAVSDEVETDRTDLSITSNLPYVMMHELTLGPALVRDSDCNAVRENYDMGLERLLLAKMPDDSRKLLEDIKKHLSRNNSCAMVKDELAKMTVKNTGIGAEVYNALRLTLDRIASVK